MSQSCRGQIEVSLRCLLRPFLKRVQHMNGASQTGNVDDPVGAERIANSDFAHAGPDYGQRLSVVWILAFLKLLQFVSHLSSNVVWKVANSIERVAVKCRRLERHHAFISLFV
jgi:hypothetical protein